MSLSADQITFYQENGFIRLKDVLDTEVLTHFREVITNAVRQWSAEAFITQLSEDCGVAFADKMAGLFLHRIAAPVNDTYAQAFTQRMNLWRQQPAIEHLVRSKRLAALAADLMQVSGVRLYHDQALFKEAQGGYTPWHVDQFYWPLSNSNTITLWLPLQAVSADMGPLAFAAGSHRATPEQSEQAENLAISEQSEQQLAQLMQEFDYVEAPFDPGEVSFHSGWTCHRANGNNTTATRAAFTIIYMQDSISMITPQHRNHAMDAKMWLPGIEPGQPAASPINPVLFSRK